MSIISTPRAAMAAAFADAFRIADLPVAWAIVQEAKPGSGFDYQCAGALRVGSSSIAAATIVRDEMARHEAVARASVSGRGFVNVRLHDDFLAGSQAIPKMQPASILVIDFGGPNIAKPLHVGHMRSLVIGESLRRTLQAVGHEVISDIHLGDWGLPMGQVIDAIRLEHPDLPCFRPGWNGVMRSPVDVDELEAIYPAAAEACRLDTARLDAARAATARLQEGESGYTALWRALRDVSIAAVAKVIDRLDVHYDLWLGESDASASVPALIERATRAGIARSSDGAIVVDVARPEDGERSMPPLILRKSDGSSTYATTDVVTLETRMDVHGPDRVLYVVDRRQADHFAQLARATARMGIAHEDQVVHVAFGTVNGTDGKPLRTRNGGVARLDALLDDAAAAASARMPDAGLGAAETVGIGALKFLDLVSPRNSGYVFDLDRALAFEGDTGPYVQYAAVRIGALLAKASASPTGDPALVGGAAAHDLLLECARVADAVNDAVVDLEPCRIAQQMLRVARSFSRFYADAAIIGAPDEAHRVALCRLTRERLVAGLDLLGIEVPNRM